MFDGFMLQHIVNLMSYKLSDQKKRKISVGVGFMIRGSIGLGLLRLSHAVETQPSFTPHMPFSCQTSP